MVPHPGGHFIFFHFTYPCFPAAGSSHIRFYPIIFASWCRLLSFFLFGHCSLSLRPPRCRYSVLTSAQAQRLMARQLRSRRVLSTPLFCAQRSFRVRHIARRKAYRPCLAARLVTRSARSRSCRQEVIRPQSLDVGSCSCLGVLSANQPHLQTSLRRIQTASLSSSHTRERIPKICFRI